MEQYALEPCPFCGGQVELTGAKYDVEEDTFECAVRCLKAGCYATTVFAFRDAVNIRKKLPNASEDEIAEEVRWQTVRSWNRRVE